MLDPDFVALVTPNMQSRILLRWSVGSDSLLGRAHDAVDPEIVELLFLIWPVTGGLCSGLDVASLANGEACCLVGRAASEINSAVAVS